MGIKEWMHAVYAIFIRNLKIITRQRQLLVAPIVLPIVIMFFTALVMGSGGDQWPIALVNQSDSQHAKELVGDMKSVHSNITKYFEIKETELEAAREKVREGRLQLLVIIPPEYEQEQVVYTETFNVNSDMMKNVRLRLEHAIINNLKDNRELKIEPILHTEKEEDVWRAAFISGSSFLIALFFGAIITSANLFAFDRENRTRKEILLTPLNLSAAGIGTIASTIVITLFTSLPTLLFGVIVFSMKIQLANLLLTYLGMIPILVASAGLGIVIAHFLKNYRVFQPLIIVGSMATFFGAGGFASLAVLPEGAQRFAEVWVFSYIFEIFNPILHSFKSSLTFGQVLIFIGIAIATILLVPFIYKREAALSISSGQ